MRLLLLVPLPLAACGAKAPAYSTPEECATAYLQAVVDGNTSLIRDMSAPTNLDPAYNIGEEEQPEPTADVQSFRILNTVDRGQFATVDADVTLNDGTTHLFRMMMIKRDERWVLGRRSWMNESERR